MPFVIADALAAPALLDGVVTPSHLPVMGRAMVIVRARRWRRHAGGRAPERPHVPPQRVEDVLLWKRKPVVVQDGERRVVVHCLRQVILRLRQELLGPEVVLGSTICSPQEHSEQERHWLVAPPGSPIEIVERRIKGPAVLSEDGPHTHDEERLQVARAVGVDDQSLADRLAVDRLLQRPLQLVAMGTLAMQQREEQLPHS